MKARTIALLIAVGGMVFTPHFAAAQVDASTPTPDEKAVRDADDAFWRAFNACDAAAMATFFGEDVEFYHDITGLTRSRPAVVASLLKGPCGTPGLHLRRQLVPNSVRYQAIPGYGAMLSGDHLFYSRQGTAPEQPATLARFLVIWKRDSERWLMTRIVSYDHRPAPYVPPAAEVAMPAEMLHRYVGRYRTAASGDIDIALENGALVLRSGGLRVNLGASAIDHFFARERDLRISFAGRPQIATIIIEENGAVVARGQRVDPR